MSDISALERVGTALALILALWLGVVSWVIAGLSDDIAKREERPAPDISTEDA